MMIILLIHHFLILLLDSLHPRNENSSVKNGAAFPPLFDIVHFINSYLPLICMIILKHKCLHKRLH